jgi:phage shock protein B
MDKGTLAVLLIFAIPLLSIAGTFVLKALKILKGISPEQNQQLQAEETRLIQEMHRGLAKMEERVETLETLLLDGRRKEACK